MYDSLHFEIIKLSCVFGNYDSRGEKPGEDVLCLQNEEPSAILMLNMFSLMQGNKFF